MAANFSNQGIDTFDPTKQYIGIRLQQGVPLLDRDWNELEDIRRHYERMMRRHYIGDGVPDSDGFSVSAAGLDDEVLINAGRISANGFDIESSSVQLFSERSRGQLLPGPPPGLEQATIEVWLVPEVERVDDSVDPSLRNEQDVNIVTCVRDRLDWSVRAVVEGEARPAGATMLARITRQRDQHRIDAQHIEDTRRSHLSLAATVDQLQLIRRRVDDLETRMNLVATQVGKLQYDVDQLYWEIECTPERTDNLFGGKATIKVTVRTRSGAPVRGARLSLSTDWGTLPTTTVSTGPDGTTHFELAGVPPESPLKLADLGILQSVTEKVELARLKNPGAIEYAKVALAPHELSVVSKYTPSAHLADLAVDIPKVALVERPENRTATVTIHATDGDGSIVRGVGSVQVRFGLWVRDWVRSKLRDVVDRVRIEARMGDALRRRFNAQTQELDVAALSNHELPVMFQSVADSTTAELKATLFDNGDLDDDDLHGSGAIAQVVAQEATAAIGAAANRAIAGQIRLLQEDATIPDFDAGRASSAKNTLTQASSQLTAGLTQGHKQLFSQPRGGI